MCARIGLIAAVLVAGCAGPPRQGLSDAPSYAIAVSGLIASAEDMRRTIETGITVGESCAAPVTPAQFQKFREIAQRGELIGPPFTEAVYEIMVIRVQGSDGSFVGFGGWSDGRDVTGMVYRLRDRDYDAAMKIAERIANYPDCLDGT